MSCIRIQSISMTKAICWVQHTQKKQKQKNGDKDGKVLYKLMNNVAYEKTIESLRNRIVVKLVSNKKDFLERRSKPNYMSYKIFDNGLVTLTLNKPAYLGMCILELSKVLNIMITQTN